MTMAGSRPDGICSPQQRGVTRHRRQVKTTSRLNDNRVKLLLEATQYCTEIGKASGSICCS